MTILSSTGCWIESAVFEMAMRHTKFGPILPNSDLFFPKGFAIMVFGQFLHFWPFFVSKVVQFILSDILALFALILRVLQKDYAWIKMEVTLNNFLTKMKNKFVFHKLRSLGEKMSPSRSKSVQN